MSLVVENKNLPRFLVIDPRTGRSAPVSAPTRGAARRAGARELTMAAGSTELDALEREVIVLAVGSAAPPERYASYSPVEAATSA